MTGSSCFIVFNLHIIEATGKLALNINPTNALQRCGCHENIISASRKVGALSVKVGALSIISVNGTFGYVLFQTKI
jgi:hypothetical protein